MTIAANVSEGAGRVVGAGASRKSSPEARPLRIMGEQVYIRLRSSETGGAYSVIEDETPPGGGPPLHVHSYEDESFCVLEGEYEIQIGEEVVRGVPGTWLFAPRGVPHRFKNVSPGTSRLLALFSPGGFEEFFEEVDAAGSEGPPAFPVIVGIAERYGNHAL